MSVTYINKKPKPVALALLLGVFLFASCSTYRHGFISLKKQTPATFSANTDSLIEVKKQLDTASVQLMQDLYRLDQDESFLSSAFLHRLFANMQAHLRVDSCFQYLMEAGANDSIRQMARKNLLNSSDFYRTIFQPDKNIRQIINRGDPAFHVPRNVLLSSQKFLWSEQAADSLRNLQKQFRKEKRYDGFHRSMYNSAGFCSELFSRAVLPMHLKLHPERNVDRLLPHLQKWDIVLQKSDKFLTDVFIPGYFGHVGIYLGDQIFVEAIQRGTIFSSPLHFAKGDIFVVLRLKNISEKDNLRMAQIMAGQLGKKYDFNFDVESPNEIVCTELIFQIFESVAWQVKKTAGRYVIPPDYILKTALHSDRFSFPIYMDENQVVEKPSLDFVEKILHRE